jgi:hypothetical protein
VTQLFLGRTGEGVFVKPGSRPEHLGILLKIVQELLILLEWFQQMAKTLINAIKSVILILSSLPPFYYVAIDWIASFIITFCQG